MTVGIAQHAQVTGGSKLVLHGFSMVRNEADIIDPFIRQASVLFDKFTFIDCMSVDGAQSSLAQAERRQNIVVLSCADKPTHEAAIMDVMARQALQEGADWSFFLNADDFLPVEDRMELDAYLNGLAGDILAMPRINLIPSAYGDFGSFDPSQDFRWSGRPSNACKIAVSSLFLHSHRDARMAEGLGAVAASALAEPAPQSLSFPLLHVPVRSRERLKYNIANLRRGIGGRNPSPWGSELFAQILDLIGDGEASSLHLNAIAAACGQNQTAIEPLDPVRLEWPVRQLPAYLRAPSGASGQTALSLGATLAAEAHVKWNDDSFVREAPVTAMILGNELRIAAQPLSGRMEARYQRFASLPSVHPAVAAPIAPDAVPKRLTSILAATLLPVEFVAPSAWSRLIPALFAIFAIARPRRFVELGVHNGVSFFAGCQIARHLGASTECVAVDSWEGDPHASFYGSNIFKDFKTYMGDTYPDAYFIRGIFSQARECFENESIDLLHIDGYHTYVAVKDNFDTWLEKMSQTGIVIFHDINVHERNFCVWRFWKELNIRYPSISFMHSYGLGIIYVGSQNNVISQIFAWMNENPEYFNSLQKYFEVLGENAIDHREKADQARRLKDALEHAERSSAADLTDRDMRMRRLETERDETIRRLEAERDETNRSLEAERDGDLDRLRRERDQAVRGMEAERQARLEAERNLVPAPAIELPFDAALGDRRDHMIVVAKALGMYARVIRIKSALLLPFRSRRKRYCRQGLIAKFIRRAFGGAGAI